MNAKVIAHNVIQDDLGEVWAYEQQCDGDWRIRCIGDDSEGGGYLAENMLEAVEELERGGYITITPEFLAELERHLRQKQKRQQAARNG